MTSDLNINLTPTQALVLIDWLSKIDDKGDQFPIFQHEAERLVLWKIEGQIESVLAEVFAENYDDILREARQKVVSDG
jgi:hypothetical protein